MAQDKLATILEMVQRSAKAAAAPGDPGDSTHPSASQPDPGRKEPNEGAHAKEVDQTLKDTIPLTANATSDSVNEGKQEVLHGETAAKATAPGDNPELEDAYETTPKDPGDTDSEARVDVKSASLFQQYRGLPRAKLAAEVITLVDAALADLARGAKQAAAPVPAPAAAPTPEQAAEAGYKAAEASGLTEAQVYAAQQTCLNLIDRAQKSAHLLGPLLLEAEQRLKAAAAGEDGPAPSEDETAPAPMPEEPGGGPPGPMGAEDPMAMIAGQGDEGPEAAIEELISALLERGISEEEIMQLLSGAGGGMPGGEGAGGGMSGGGMPPELPPDAKMASQRLLKAVKVASTYKRAGKYPGWTPPRSDKRARLRQTLRGQVNEVLRHFSA